MKTIIQRHTFYRKKNQGVKAITLFISIAIFSVSLFAQDNNGGRRGSKKEKNGKGFHAGLFVGTYFANKQTAGLYDGYGYDLDGNKNTTFANSWMYEKIINEYGGGNGQPDRIAPLLGVNHGDWTFDQTDMPTNLKYNIAFIVGFNARYCFNNRDAIMLNVNGSKLTVQGDFTITITNPPIGYATPGYVDYKTFGINGTEQRLVFMAGYQRVLGDTDQLMNFVIEGGPIVTMTKFTTNQILIDAQSPGYGPSLQIDLMNQYSNIGYLSYKARNLTKVGYGGFLGLGINLRASARWTLQLIYDPSYELINLGNDQPFTLQHSLGLRAYYNL